MHKAKHKERVRDENAKQQKATDEEIRSAIGEDGTVHNQFEEEYEPEDQPSKKKKYAYSEVLDHPDDDLALRYRHIRSGPRTVKSEFYLVKSILQSQYHMSDEQSDGAIMVVANYLFGRKEFGEWKPYVQNSEATNNTLPAHSNRRRVEVQTEALALALIVEEIMSGTACVVYSNDGSAQSGVGNFVVQSMFVNGIQRNLPTFGVFSENRHLKI